MFSLIRTGSLKYERQLYTNWSVCIQLVQVFACAVLPYSPLLLIFYFKQASFSSINKVSFKAIMQLHCTVPELTS